VTRGRSGRPGPRSLSPTLSRRHEPALACSGSTGESSSGSAPRSPDDLVRCGSAHALPPSIPFVTPSGTSTTSADQRGPNDKRGRWASPSPVIDTGVDATHQTLPAA
jgi:hypothetical protein